MHRAPAYPVGPSSAILDPERVAHLFPPQMILQWFEHELPGRVWRERKLPRPVLFLAALLHALEGRQSFRQALDEAAILIEPGALCCCISDGSVTPARCRLPAEVLELGRRHIVDLYAEIKAPSPLANFRVLCIDGTTFSLADSKDNAAFGYPGCKNGKSGNPCLKACFVMDAASHLFIEAVRGGYREVSEQEMADYAIETTAAQDVLFEMDRGLYSVARLRRIKACGADVLCRVPSQVKLPLLKRLCDGSYLSFVRDNNASRTAPCGSCDDDLLLRVIEYEIVDGHGQRREFRLVTTVTEPHRLNARDAAQGYHLRWREEVGIRELKWMTHRFAKPNFRGMSPKIVQQEFEAMLLAHASLRLLMALAARERGVDPTRLSLSGALSIVARLLRLPANGAKSELYMWLSTQLARQRLDKPNGRVCPRAIKARRSPFPTRPRGSPCSTRPKHRLRLIRR